MKIETPLVMMRDESDWSEVFKYAATPTAQPSGKEAPGFTLDDVEAVLASVEGENDGPE